MCLGVLNFRGFHNIVVLFLEFLKLESNESNDIINQNISNEVSGKKISKYATDMLNYHNNIREQCENTPKLKWNSELAKKSKFY